MNDKIFYGSTFSNSDSPVPVPVLAESPQATKPQIVYNKNEGGFKIGVTPGAITGALIGGMLAKRKVLKDENERLMREQAIKAKNTPKIEGNYYSQMQNVAKNINVVFTPMSAIYVVNNGKKTFTLDTIETDEMNPDMKRAWEAKDSEYFKSVMFGKMLTEMQLAEKVFTKRFLKKQAEVNDSITGKFTDTSDIDNLSECDLFLGALKQAKFYERGNDLKEKLASAITNDIESECEPYEINLKLDRPLSKYAGVISGLTSSLGITSGEDNLNKTKKDLSNPRKVMRDVQVGFFPDRVVFSLNNQLISTLPITSMNDEGYEHFSKQNSKYFKSIFCDSVKEQMRKKKASVTNSFLIEKTAADTDSVAIEDNCLLSSDTHPIILYMYITNKIGPEWLKYDMMIIEDVLKREFDLEDIPETNLNKIMTIMLANQSDTVYVNAYAFEKAIISLNNKPVDFLTRDIENVGFADIVFAIDVLDRVTPFDDIYDNFSIEIFNYIADALSRKDLYVYNPTNIVGSPLEPAFKTILNKYLLKAIVAKMTLDTDDKKLEEEIKDQCEYIAGISAGILVSVRGFLEEKKIPEEVNLGALIDTIISKRGIKDRYRTIIRNQVILNLSIDKVLAIKESQFKDQLDKYNILGGELIE